MIQKRDLVNRSLTALESKLESLRNHVIRRFPIEDYIQLTEDCKSNLSIVKNNLVASRNNDILAKEFAALERNLIFLREAVDGRHPVEKFLTTIETAEKSLEAIDQAVQREPLSGFELSKNKKVN